MKNMSKLFEETVRIYSDNDFFSKTSIIQQSKKYMSMMILFLGNG